MAEVTNKLWMMTISTTTNAEKDERGKAVMPSMRLRVLIQQRQIEDKYEWAMVLVRVTGFS
jgi:hypothetical protein